MRKELIFLKLKSKLKETPNIEMIRILVLIKKPVQFATF